MIDILLIFLSLILTSATLATIVHYMPNIKSIILRKFWMSLGTFLFAKISLRVLELSDYISHSVGLYLASACTLMFSAYVIWFLNHHYGDITND